MLDSKPYNHTLAAELAVWSSLSYIHPDNISRENLNYLVKTKTNGDYRVSTNWQNKKSGSGFTQSSAWPESVVRLGIITENNCAF